MGIKNLLRLLVLSLGLLLAPESTVLAQAQTPNCDTSSFASYLLSQLPLWDIDASCDLITGINCPTYDQFRNCTDFISCLPIVSPIMQTFSQRNFGAYCTGNSCPTDWATVCPECIMAIALIITISIYFKQNETPANNTLAFALGDLTTHLNNVIGNNTPAAADCEALFTAPNSFLCESVLALGNLFQTFASTAIAKQDAAKICFDNGPTKAIFEKQANGLAACVDSLLNQPIAPGTSCSTTVLCPSGDDCVNGNCLIAAIPAAIAGDIINIKNLLLSYQTAITGLANCCATADRNCALALGANYSSAVVTQSPSSSALQNFQKLMGYQAFSFSTGT